MDNSNPNPNPALNKTNDFSPNGTGFSNPNSNYNPNPNIETKPKKIGKESDNINQFEKKIKSSKSNKPYKLGEKPNSIKSFEENLKKQHEENELIKLEKEKQKQSDKQHTKQTKEIKKESREIKQNKINDVNNANNANERILPPKPIIIDNILGDDADEFEKFKLEIMANPDIDDDMKNIMIESRKENILKRIENNKKKIEQNKRQNLVIELVSSLQKNNFKNITWDQQCQILKLINKWIEGKLYQNHIMLNSPQLYIVYEQIDLLGMKSEIKNIFAPLDPDDYIDYTETMEAIKINLVEEEKKRVMMELEREELEKKRMSEIELRKNKTLQFITLLNKMSVFDPNVKNIKLELELSKSIEKYVELETDYIIITPNLYEQIINFIKTIRMSENDKEQFILCMSSKL